MTKEEAVNELHSIANWNRRYKDGSPRLIEACELAIEVLEQESCNDCISREAALKALCKECGSINAALCVEQMPCNEYRNIDAIPAADVKPVVRRGK